MRINELLDKIKQTNITAGGLRVGDFVKNKKTGATGVVIMVESRVGKIKARVWLTRGKIAPMQNILNYQKIGTPAPLFAEVLSETDKTFKISSKEVVEETESSDGDDPISKRSGVSDSDISSSDFERIQNALISRRGEAVSDSTDSDISSSDFERIQNALIRRRGEAVSDSADSDISSSDFERIQNALIRRRGEAVSDSADSDFPIADFERIQAEHSPIERDSEDDVQFLEAVQRIQTRAAKEYGWEAEKNKIRIFFKIEDADQTSPGYGYDADSEDADYIDLDNTEEEEKVNNDTRLSLSRSRSMSRARSAGFYDEEDYENGYFNCLQTLAQERELTKAVAQRAFVSGQQFAQMQALQQLGWEGNAYIKNSSPGRRQRSPLSSASEEKSPR
jgi:hypothetical protein